MKLNRVELRNIRSVRHIAWEIGPEQGPGWHVILGDNGAGKSTFLRAVALALIGPAEAAGLRQNWNEWLARGENTGSIDLAITADPQLDFASGKGRIAADSSSLQAGVRLTRTENQVELRAIKAEHDPDRYIWGTGDGWFSASYGPFRRFSGGDRQFEKLFYSEPKLARHLSVFGEDVALTEALEWVKKLQFKKLENSPDGALLDRLIEFVNQPDFLPHDARLQRVSSEGVFFFDGNGRQIPVLELSDGYRSILSLSFELIRQLALAYGSEQVFDPHQPGVVLTPGVVLIDEVDVHLHPSWQRRVGLWFRRHFPNLQFIVTTHSPLICQAAEIGTVFRLPTPGTDEPGRFLEGTELERLLYGNILDAYSTGAFGDNVSRSAAGKDRLRRLAELNLRSLNSGLSPQEEAERGELQAATPTAAQSLQLAASEKA